MPAGMATAHSRAVEGADGSSRLAAVFSIAAAAAAQRADRYLAEQPATTEYARAQLVRAETLTSLNLLEEALEVLDTILMAYRLGEDRRVRLPVLVNLDGFYLSFTREPVQLPEPEGVDAFLPPFDAEAIVIAAAAPFNAPHSVVQPATPPAPKLMTLGGSMGIISYGWPTFSSNGQSTP